jgi:hypothetical protein
VPPACDGGEAVTLGVEPVTISVVDYTDNTECTWVITGVPPIQLNFTSFDTKHGSDYVTVYKGNGTSGRLLRYFSGSDLPPPVQWSAGTLTVVFTSDSRVSAKGFVAVLQAAAGVPLAAYPGPLTGIWWSLCVCSTEARVLGSADAVAVESRRHADTDTSSGVRARARCVRRG